MNEIVAEKPNELVDIQAQRIVDFLKNVGLPADNIIADQAERTIIGNNLPEFIANLPDEVKREGRYLSKFVVGAGYGLFDYSLNAIWNEVVLDLRKKVILYGLEIFYDAAVGGGRAREFYQSENDLPSIKDSVLLTTCRKLELISNTTYSKLKHILDMRNDIGISHPTNYTINAYELMGWLQTCVQDVLNDRPTEAAIQVQAFISNLKSRTDPIDAATITTIEQRIAELPSHLCGNILRTVFGIFVSPETEATVRKNISIIAPALWNSCIDEPKYKLGLVLEGYKANLHTDKHVFGAQFFETVGGNSFKSTSERLIIVNEQLIDLMDKHNGWDNFHHEAPVAASLASYLPDQASILPNIAERLFKTILICRIGRGVTYNSGVSPRGKPYYDHFLTLCGDQYAPLLMTLLGHYEIQNELSQLLCRTQAKQALEAAKTNVINQRLIECLDYLIGNIEASKGCALSTDFRRLSSEYIQWS